MTVSLPHIHQLGVVTAALHCNEQTAYKCKSTVIAVGYDTELNGILPTLPTFFAVKILSVTNCLITSHKESTLSTSKEVIDQLLSK